MNKDKQKDYARRISQANRTELVVITYDIIIDGITEAAAELSAGNTAGYRACLKRTQRFLAELMSALDFRYAVSRNLMSLYEYVQRVLVSSEVGGEDRGLDSARRVIDGLRSSFAQIAVQDDSGAVMENAQNIYAGLTYGRGSLNEINPDVNSQNRGFLA